MKKIGGFGFFVSDVISGVALWPFCLGLPSPYDDPTYDVTHKKPKTPDLKKIKDVLCKFCTFWEEALIRLTASHAN